MAVAFDTQGTKFEAASTTSFTNSTHTVGASANALVLFLQFNTGGAAPTSINVTWDSVAMTLIGTKATSVAGAWAYKYGLLAPHTGNKTLSVSWTNAASYGGVTVAFTGADQTAFATTFKNLTSDASTPGATGNYPTGGLAVTTNSGDMAVGCFATANGSFGTGGGLGTQAQWAATNVGGDSRYLAAVGASTVLAGNATTASQTYCAIACAIAAAGTVVIPDLQAQACL
jgi:hypothetical protein